MTKPTKKQDDIVADLIKIFIKSRDGSNEIDENRLMANLVPYIVDRDHKVFNHAYKLGKEASNNGQQSKK